MILQKIQRTGAVAGLCAAMAMLAPTGVMAAAAPNGPAAPTTLPALAAPVTTAAATLSDDGVQVAQNRRALERRNRALRHNNRNLRQRNRNLANRPNRVYRNNRWYHRRGDYYYDNSGAVLAGALIAGTAGLIAGSALSNSNRTVVVQEPSYGVAPYSAEWYRQCDLKYNSFRASDGTYLGYDGYRHTCRIP